LRASRRTCNEHVRPGVVDDRIAIYDAGNVDVEQIAELADETECAHAARPLSVAYVATVW